MNRYFSIFFCVLIVAVGCTPKAIPGPEGLQGPIGPKGQEGTKGSKGESGSPASLHGDVDGRV